MTLYYHYRQFLLGVIYFAHGLNESAAAEHGFLRIRIRTIIPGMAKLQQAIIQILKY